LLQTLAGKPEFPRRQLTFLINCINDSYIKLLAPSVPQEAVLHKGNCRSACGKSAWQAEREPMKNLVYGSKMRLRQQPARHYRL
jgi:hypothetical protein